MKVYNENIKRILDNNMIVAMAHSRAVQQGLSYAGFLELAVQCLDCAWNELLEKAAEHGISAVIKHGSEGQQ